MYKNRYNLICYNTYGGIDMNKYILDFLKDIMAIDSPSGYSKKVIHYCQKEAEKLGFQTKKTHKGNLEIYVEGQDDARVDNLRSQELQTSFHGIAARLDRLPSGAFQRRAMWLIGGVCFCDCLDMNVGGPIIPTLDGEYCRIHTRDGQCYTGTILSNYPAVHVYKDAKSAPRDCENMHVRIDEVVKNKEDVQALGIQNGDYIAYDPKTEITESGFIKSRFLDDKISVAILFGMLKHLANNHIKPKHNLIIIISTYEEVGHGSSYIHPNIDELIAVDMGCIGEDLACSEYDVSICAKDGSGPYDYDLTSKLIELASTHQLQYAIDIYPYYSSDVSAALRGGQNIKGALIGPGVAASHGMERTHLQAVENTLKLLLAYIA